MKPISAMTQIEMAAFVQDNLQAGGIMVVLSGGAAVAYRTENRYVSFDIDLVNIYMVARKRIDEVMRALGFDEEGRYFKHPESQWFIEFPPGPLTVGVEPVGKVDEIQLPTGVLRILTATDSVKDRLAAFYHWRDEQCLRQAMLLRQNAEVDLQEVERWSAAEGKLAEFQRFLNDQ